MRTPNKNKFAFKLLYSLNNFYLLFRMCKKDVKKLNWQKAKTKLLNCKRMQKQQTKA